MSAADVKRLLDAARRVQRDAMLIDELVATTGLSREGVLRGLRDHLEVDASDAEVASLVRAAGTCDEVHLVLSANVFVAPLRALSVARAASSRVVVRPSSRDPALTRALVRAAADPAIELVGAIEFSSIDRGEVHVYGRDATLAAIRAQLRTGVVFRGHGAGMGIAVVPAGAALDDAARMLAADVVPFDQRGCLSARVAFVVGDAARARDFGALLAHALDDEARTTPRGALGEDEASDARRYIETMRFAGTLFERATHVVGVGDRFAVPPPGRHVHVVAVPDLEAARAVLAPAARAVVTVGVATSRDLRRELGVPRARLSRLGAMQRPPFDGPVDPRADLGVDLGVDRAHDLGHAEG